ncbi:MAG: hypothetical protein D6828_01655, partial [Nitrospirae bacterium]
MAEKEHSKMDFSHYIEGFILTLRTQQDISKHTERAYKKDLEEFLSYCNRDVKEINNIDIRDYMASLYKRRLKKTTIGRKLSTIRSFFKYLYSMDIVKK